MCVARSTTHERTAQIHIIILLDCTLILKNL